MFVIRGSVGRNNYKLPGIKIPNITASGNTTNITNNYAITNQVWRLGPSDSV